VTALLVICAGMLIAAGSAVIVAAMLPNAPRLTPALERVTAEAVIVETRGDPEPAVRPSERLGGWLFRHTPVPLTERQRQRLRLQGKSIAEFYADKLVWALVGVALPILLAFAQLMIIGRSSPWTALAALGGLVIGFFVPDLTLRRHARATRSSAVEALLVYLDLVTLERLANASASSALQRSAELSDAPLFRQIRIALERARLEQQPPYGELRRLAERLDLPELNDVADVMQLDETGAALSGTLRARVRELRDAHLTRERLQASAAAEGMTVYMTLPALIFGLIFLVAALLTLLSPPG
jgi:tight adherence protein C